MNWEAIVSPEAAGFRKGVESQTRTQEITGVRWRQGVGQGCGKAVAVPLVAHIKESTERREDPERSFPCHHGACQWKNASLS